MTPSLLDPCDERIPPEVLVLGQQDVFIASSRFDDLGIDRVGSTITSCAIARPRPGFVTPAAQGAPSCRGMEPTGGEDACEGAHPQPAGAGRSVCIHPRKVA